MKLPSVRRYSAILPGIVLAAVTFWSGCGAPPSNTPARAADLRAPTVRGHLLIVGGGPLPPEVLSRFVELAGGPGRARIVVFPMSSSDPDAGIELTADFRKMGAAAERIVLDHAQADTAAAAARMDGVTGVWFGGGDQVLLTKALGGTRTEAAIHARYRDGAVIGGTSAGAAVMSTPMLTGDERHPGGARPPAKDSTDAFMTIARDNVVTVPGFALIRGAVVDQHFVRRRRHNRLISVVLEHPDLVGVGIDESTALEIEPGGGWRVLGLSVAVVYDARRAVITPAAAPTLGVSDIRLSVLPAGSRYDLKTGKVVLPGMR
ncbi:MAG: cyanophycinase [Acidobacteriota bacterium]